MNKLLIGIDPGQSGCIALLWPDGNVQLHDIDGSLPAAVGVIRTAKNEARSRGWIVQAVIEKVQSMPSDGNVGAFSFGETVGTLKGALMMAAISVIANPTPQAWKKKVGLTMSPPKCPRNATPEQRKTHEAAKRRYKAEMKAAARNMAMQMFPEVAHMLTRVKDSDRAESLLLCRYAQLIENGG